MIRLSWNRIINRKFVSITLLLAFICFYVIVPLGLHQSKEAKLVVNETLNKYGRGSYDILVRPSSSRSLIEKKMGMVEENYIGDSGGGISIEEWNEIKEDPDIEIAAPVSSLGYFQGKRLSIELPILRKPTKFTYQFFTTDGLRKYPIDLPNSLTYFEQTQPGLIQYIVDPSNSPSFQSQFMTILMPENYYQLVAIDVESEGELTGIDFTALQKKANSPVLDTILSNYGNPPVIKVLQRSDLNIPLSIEIKTETLDADIDDYLTKLGLQENEWLMQSIDSPKTFNEILKDIEKEKVIASHITEIDLSNFQKPFDGTALKINEQLKPSLSERGMMDHNTSVYYTTSKIQYNNLGGIPKINIVEKNGEVPSYKEVYKKGISMLESTKIPFVIEQVGQFLPTKKPKEELASSPLGIYGGMVAKTEDGKTLMPTITPGSFIPAPASGITTLESAKVIKGDRPIDAIRIRVAGIKSYNEKAQGKIEEVATKLLEKGYEVDIVAGSSFKQMTLDVEAIGKVQEPWTTLGVAQEIRNTWNYMRLLTVCLFIVFSILWIVIRLTFEKSILSDENELLYVIGWRQSKINLRNCLEHYIVMIVALCISVFLMTLLNSEWYMYLITVGLVVLSVLITTILILKKQKPKTRISEYKLFPAIFHYKNIILPTMLIMLLSTILIATQVSSIGYSLQETSITSLGEFTNNQTSWLQLTVTIFTFILATIAISECLNTLLIERKEELSLYYKIGWTRNKVILHMTKEFSIWAMFSTLFGLIIAGVLLFTFNISLTWILIGLGNALLTITFVMIILILTRKLN